MVIYSEPLDVQHAGASVWRHRCCNHFLLVTRLQAPAGGRGRRKEKTGRDNRKDGRVSSWLYLPSALCLGQVEEARRGGFLPSSLRRSIPKCTS